MRATPFERRRAAATPGRLAGLAAVVVPRIPLTGELADLSAYVDGEVSRARRLQLQLHLRGCEPCREYVAQLRLVRRAVGELGEGALSPELNAALATAYARWRVLHAPG